jgi:hypothetical protein
MFSGILIMRHEEILKVPCVYISANLSISLNTASVSLYGMYMFLPNKLKPVYSETSIHRFRRGSEKETMDPGKQ